MLKEVFRIRFILIWIRILGSVSWNGDDWEDKAVLKKKRPLLLRTYIILTSPSPCSG